MKGWTPHDKSASSRHATIAGRSLFPLSALVIVAGTALWGPWVTLGLAYGWWRLVARIG
jgi:hypothetical protein